MDALPDDLVDPVEIHDLYLRATHLRLRKATSAGETTWKLGQKVRLQPESAETVMITNIYLGEGEYDVLNELVGARLRKTRWHWAWEGSRLSVDVFDGHLKGLVLAEIELDPDAAFLRLPEGASADVTDDDRYSGARLAWLTPHEAGQLLTMAR
jgi:CYTH domain-containing protein